ncbi:MAG: 2-hydroxyacid dehydrogenase [Hyphomicrobiaceae bacterium]
MTKKIVLLDNTAPAQAERLRALLPTGFELSHGTARGEDHLKEIIREADFAISAQVAVTGDVLRAAPQLKLLHKWGVGVDNFDVDAARGLGIKVARTTGSNALPVAEFTLGLMVATLRFQALGHERLRQGRWMAFNELPGPALCISGSTVGIVGFGAIGQTVARLLGGFGCRVLYNKRSRLPADEEQALGAEFAAMADLLASSDIVSLHCPLTPETTDLINTESISQMKPTAVLVNVARGGVVNEDDLAAALHDRRIRGAAMDVYSIEPLPSGSPLLGLDNIVLTPHLAAATADTFEPTVRRMFENIARVSRGEPLPLKDEVA